MEGLGGVVRAVSPETVVAGSDTCVMTEMSLNVYRIKLNEKRTETGNEVIENTPNRCLPAKLGVQSTVQSESGCDGQNSGTDPVNVPQHVAPSDRWQLFLVLQGPSDIVVGDVSILRDDLLVFCKSEFWFLNFIVRLDGDHFWWRSLARVNDGRHNLALVSSRQA